MDPGIHSILGLLGQSCEVPHEGSLWILDYLPILHGIITSDYFQ